MPGKILIYTGNGEGKTIASPGHAIRSWAIEKKLQFRTTLVIRG